MTQQLEICAETLQACEAAAEGGADRIELCAALAEGGVTPSLGFLGEAIASVTTPIHVLIRPRSSDFCYSAAEFRMMCRDTETALQAGASGIVVGLLTADRQIDRSRMAKLVEHAQGHPVTFHRAFDHTQNLSQSLEILVALGCERVLTSGGMPNVIAGRSALVNLASLAAGRIRVAAGGGVTLGNATQLTSIPGLDLHASLRGTISPTSDDPLWNAPAGKISVEAVRSLSRLVHTSNLVG